MFSASRLAPSTQMATTHVDIHTFVWLDHESVGLPLGHARALELFRDSVLRPSLKALDQEIEANQRSEDPAADFFTGDLEDLYQATVEGYILTVQSMWERALRGLLIHRDKKLFGGQRLKAIQRDPWSSEKGPTLQAHFAWMLGVPPNAFDAFEDLDLLQNLGSAIRHGDGNAAKKVHELAPSLWWNWLPPGGAVQAGPFNFAVPADWPPHPSFNKVTLTQQVLEQMVQSVVQFWTDLELMRCNSFKNKHESTQRWLDEWPAERALRASKRLWTAG